MIVKYGIIKETRIMDVRTGVPYTAKECAEWSRKLILTVFVNVPNNGIRTLTRDREVHFFWSHAPAYKFDKE